MRCALREVLYLVNLLTRSKGPKVIVVPVWCELKCFGRAWQWLRADGNFVLCTPTTTDLSSCCVRYRRNNILPFPHVAQNRIGTCVHRCCILICYFNLLCPPLRTNTHAYINDHTSYHQVGLVATSRVDNRLLTGVQFLVDGSHRIIGLAYDCDLVQIWHKLG